MIVDVSEVKSIYICSKKVDFRKQIDGLVTFIEFEFGQDVIDGSLFIFVNGYKNKIKMIYYDGSGFWMLVKRMEKGIAICSFCVTIKVKKTVDTIMNLIWSWFI